MPKVIHVKKAQKDIPGTNIKKGDSYYWWKFRFGGKHTSKSYPTPAMLTTSEFLKTIYAINDDLSGASFSEPEDVESFVDEVKSQIEDLQSETQDKLDNMPESLQSSPTGELLQERIDALGEMMDELDNIDYDFSSDLTIDDIDISDTELDEDEEDEDVIHDAKLAVLEAKQEDEKAAWIEERENDLNNIQYNGS